MLDLTSHTAVPTTFIMDEEGELMASFSITNKVSLVAFLYFLYSFQVLPSRWAALLRRR